MQGEAICHSTCRNSTYVSVDKAFSPLGQVLHKPFAISRDSLLDFDCSLRCEKNVEFLCVVVLANEPTAK